MDSQIFEPEFRRGDRKQAKAGFLLLGFFPLLWTLILAGILLCLETPGFRVEVTQTSFVVSHVDARINDVEEADLITRVSGIPYAEIIHPLSLVNWELSGMEGITILRQGKLLEKQLESRPITLALLLKKAWFHFLWVILITFLAVAALFRAPPEQPAGLFLTTYSFFSLVIINELPCHFGILIPGLMALSFWAIAVFHWLAFSSWAHFVFQFPVERRLLDKKPVILALIYILPPAIAIGLSLDADGNIGDFAGKLQHYRYWATPWIIVVTFLKHLTDFFLSSSASAKSQLKLLLSGGFAGISPYLFLYLLPNIFFDQPLIAFQLVMFFGTLIPLAIFLAIIRYNLMDVDQLISRGATYFILLTGLIFLYSGFLVLVKHWVWGSKILSQNLFVIFLVCIALVFNPLKTRLQAFLDRIFLRDSLDYSLQMHRFSNRIVQCIQLPDLINLLTRVFPDVFRINKCILVLADETHCQVYPFQAAEDGSSSNPLAIVKALKEHPAPLNIYDVKQTESSLQMPLTRMREMGIPLAYGLHSAQEFHGALLIGEKSNHRMYTRSDIRILKTLANSASIALENAVMYDSLKKSRDQIRLMFRKVTQTEKLAAIGEMTAVLAHEIQNPLAIIRSSAEFLSEKKCGPGIQKELLSNILQEIDTLGVVVNNTLGLARCKPPEFAWTNLHTLLQELTRKWTAASDHRSDVSITISVQGPIPEIRVDEKQVSQVFINLIKNSESAMPEGGNIDIELMDCPEEEKVVICFRDTGTGLPAGSEENLFKKFYTTKEDGLGVGLVVCEQVIHAHSGSIRIENNSEKGVCATLHLPYEPEKALAESYGT